MSTPNIEGELVWAGTMNVRGEVWTGVFVRLTPDELRAVPSLPMYRRVAVVAVGETQENLP